MDQGQPNQQPQEPTPSVQPAQDSDPNRRLTKRELREQRRSARKEEQRAHDKRQANRRAVLWSSVVLAVVAIVVVIVAIARASGPKNDPVGTVDPVSAGDHVFGLPSSSVTLIEYSDYQCPACGVYHPIVKQLVEAYKDKITFVLRNFPLPQHPNEMPAASAAEAASLQGKFWDMYDAIYDGQSSWSNLDTSAAEAVFRGYAEKIGLDMAKFDADLGSDAVDAKIDMDRESGVKAGVNKTPSFFLNGQPIDPRSYDEFKQFIDQALAAS